MKKNTAMPMILSALIPMIANMPGISGSKSEGLTLSHKERVKSGITHKQPKPGKNHPAKGYNPVTKTWDKK
jgi:hypothetical protein